jgi:hypothetical protein
LGGSRCRSIKHEYKIRKTNLMKKFLLITSAAIVATVGVTYAANSMLKLGENSKCENGTARCTPCKGSGWAPNGQSKCLTCKGTGANSSY